MPLAQCVIGVGSPHGDDRIGWLVADEVRHRLGEHAVVCKVRSPLEILDWMNEVEWLGICDACRGDGPEGTWHCWNWPDNRILKQDFIGSHDFGLTAALDLAQRLRRLPPTVMIWGVEIGNCVPGDSVSISAKGAIPLVSDAIVREIMLAR